MTLSNCKNEERLALFSQEGEPIEGSVLRTEAHEKGILHGASHTYIGKKEKGEICLLLQRRSEFKDSFAGCLDTSSAGHVEFGYNHIETAMKELEEELGIRVAAEELIELFTQEIYQVSEFYGKPFIDHEINRVYLLARDVDPKSLRFQPSEVSGAVWMKAADILRLLEEKDGSVCIAEKEFKQVLAEMEKYI